MPLFSYQCLRCGLPVECVVSYADRDKPMLHDVVGCGGSLERIAGLELPTLGKSAFQTKAVLGNGDHLAGHFGKDAVRRRR